MMRAGEDRNRLRNRFPNQGGQAEGDGRADDGRAHRDGDGRAHRDGDRRAHRDGDGRADRDGEGRAPGGHGPNGRRPRLSDVAEHAGVSTSTASRALNGTGDLSPETRAAVIRAAAELNFRPSPLARSLRTKRSVTVGLVMPTVAHAFYAAVTEGAQRVLEEHGYRLILVDAGDDGERVAQAVRTLLDHEVDGLLMSTSPLPARRFNQLFAGTPCVFIDELAPGAGVCNVVLENARGVEMLVDHIVGHGHERIAFLGGPVDRTSGRERLEGFEQAMRRHGLAVAEELVEECEWTMRSGYIHATKLLERRPSPTALITASGELALGTLAAARQAGIAIPDELALASFDDLYFAPLLSPSMTAVAYDARAIGSEGARLLLARMQEPGQERSEVRIDVRLVCRRSCGCALDPDADIEEVLR
jgi:LacI family transcriptional regulator